MWAAPTQIWPAVHAIEAAGYSVEWTPALQTSFHSFVARDPAGIVRVACHRDAGQAISILLQQIGLDRAGGYHL